MRAGLIFVMTLGALASPTWGQEQSTVKVRVVSVSAAKPLAGDEPMLFGVHKGTHVGLLIELPGKHIVEIPVHPDPNRLKVTDESGTDLTIEEPSKPGQLARPAGARLWPSIGKENHKCAITISANQTPKADAKSIRIKGKIEILCGVKKATVDATNLTLDEKLKANAGPFKLSCGKAVPFLSFGDPDQKATSSLIVAWEGNQRVISVEAVTSNGKIQNLAWSGSSVSGLDEYRTEQQTFDAENFGKCTLRITYYDTVEKMTVPLDLKVGVGF